MLKEISEHYSDTSLLKADGFDDAVIGVSEDFNSPPRLIYSVKKVIDILMKDMNITNNDLTDDDLQNGITIQDKKYELATEYFNFNVSGAYVGETTPVWCYDNF